MNGVVDAYAVKKLHVHPVPFDYTVNVLRAFILFPLTAMSGASLAEAWRGSRRTVVVVAALSPAAYILVLFAMNLAPLSRVAPARELSLLHYVGDERR